MKLWGIWAVTDGAKGLYLGEILAKTRAHAKRKAHDLDAWKNATRTFGIKKREWKLVAGYPKKKEATK